MQRTAWNAPSRRSLPRGKTSPTTSNPHRTIRPRWERLNSRTRSSPTYADQEKPASLGVRAGPRAMPIEENNRVRKKVSIIGAGQTGASTAQRIAQHGYSDVVLTDVVEGLAEGKALDLQESAPIVGFDARVTGVTTTPDGKGYEATANSDLVIITSGVPRKPGMSRDELLAVNQQVITTVVQAIVRYSPECVIVMLTNPVDAMTQLAYKVSGFPSNRVVGQAGILDTARYKTFIALELGVSFQNVDAYVLGGNVLDRK